MSEDTAAAEGEGYRGRLSVLVALSLGVLMVMLDGTIVYVALPSIRQDLRLSDTSMIWVVNAFTLAFSGTLLLAGRLGDLYGHRRLFLIGISMFTIASIACGLANTTGLLVSGRAVQGLGGAVVAATSLSLIMEMFTDAGERAKAIGINTFICVGGGTAGLLLGGVLTSLLNWHWIFLVNCPIGVAVYLLCHFRLQTAHAKNANERLDVWGAVTVTSSLALAVYAIVNGNEAGWNSTKTLGLLGGAIALFVAFATIESRVATPLMPLGFFMSANMIVSNTVRVLWAVGASAAFFIALYMQFVLGNGPMEIGLAFLPGNLIMAAFSLGFSGRIVMRFGINRPLIVGLALSVLGLVLFARAPVDGEVLIDVIPGTILLALSAGTAAIPLLFATMVGVAPRESGLASGIVATVGTMSSALGLAVLASVAAARTEHLIAAGASSAVALTGGYRLGFLLGAACVAAAALISVAFLPSKMEHPATQKVGGMPVPRREGD